MIPLRLNSKSAFFKIIFDKFETSAEPKEFLFWRIDCLYLVFTFVLTKKPIHRYSSLPEPKGQVVKLVLHQASLSGNAQQQQWKITFKYIIGSKNLDKLANEPVNLIINQLILKREDYFN